MRKLFCIILFIFFMMPNLYVLAQESVFDNDTYQEQLEDSGAEELFDKLPSNAKKDLQNIGVNGIDFNKILDISPESLLESILGTFKQKSVGPLKSISLILAVILLNALFSALKFSIGEKPLAITFNLVAILCICMIIVHPMVKFINYVVALIKGANAFFMCYIPVMVGILVASGQPVTSVTFSSVMVTLGEIISQLSSGFFMPVLNIFLTVSIVGAISPRFNLRSVCSLISKLVKWILGALMTLFCSLLTIKGLIGSVADSVNAKTMKFVLSSCVPIVGGALGDAFTTVQGCVKLLKSGVGAFFIIAIGFIFIPAIIECIMWNFTVNICSASSDILELSVTSKLLKSISKVLSTILALILCIMIILIVSTVIILTLGGGS